MMLNRSPQNLDYWMDSVLKIVHPSAYGRIKGDLLKIANDQRGSSVSPYFTMESKRVDLTSLMPEPTGTVHSMAAPQQVGAGKLTFRCDGHYTGVELRLTGFGIEVMNKQ